MSEDLQPQWFGENPELRAEDCRARPGYYTDGLPKISDETTAKAQRAFSSAETRVGVRPWAPQKSMRAALESVLPDIERPLREEIEALKAEKAPWSKSIHELARRVDEAEALLAERDKEIERLNGNLHELRDQRNDAERRVIERDKEIERLRSSENKGIVRLTRERECVDLCAESPKNYYTAGTLRADLNDFEERYGMDSRTHYELRRGNRLPKDIRRFDSAVWAGVYEEWVRLRKGTK